jgi:copper chaperone CopZ
MKNYILTLITVLFLLPLGSQAQLLEVKQTVFGMDCAPCAYGLEKRIQKMDGIQSVSVSLNDGLLTADLKQGNTLRLEGIRKAIEESGFKAKEATITVAGKITKNDSETYVLETGSGERFLLQAENKSMQDNISGAASSVILTGRAEVSNGAETKLLVGTVEK